MRLGAQPQFLLEEVSLANLLRPHLLEDLVVLAHN